VIANLNYTERPYAGDADLQPVCDMINECSAVDNMDETFSPADVRMYINVPDRDATRDVRLWESEGGEVAAFAMLWIPASEEVAGGYLYWKVHPNARGEGIARYVIAWAERRMREVGAERGQGYDLRSGTRDDNAYARQALEEHGFQVVRYFFYMLRPLDAEITEPVLPEGYTLRHVESEADVEEWVRVHNESFVDHWDFHPMTVENRMHWRTDHAYRPELDLVAVAPDGTFAAFCSCLINEENNARNNRNEGLVDLLGTRRGHRKIGLGRAMLLAGLRALKSADMERARIGVDAENPTGALGLYESVGFQREVTNVAYHKPLAAKDENQGELA